MRDAEAIRSLAQQAISLRIQSRDLCLAAVTVVAESQEARHRFRCARQEYARQRAASGLRRAIRRKLGRGRLPYDSAAKLLGGPGAGGACDACDQPLMATQLVMSVPMGARAVRLHADCFLLWDHERRAKVRLTPAARAW